MPESMIESMRNSKENIKKRQVDMHRDFFSRAEYAVENRFYLEAIFLEYAAIEGRLEVILGVLGFPCNKELADEKRKHVNISDRIECLRKYRNNNPDVFKRTKLPNNYFTKHGKLQSWIKKRNTFVHGLLKNVDEYAARKKESYDIAKQGLEYSRRLYNEAKRIRNLVKNHPELFAKAVIICQNSNCIAIEKEKESQEAANV